MSLLDNILASDAALSADERRAAARAVLVNVRASPEDKERAQDVYERLFAEKQRADLTAFATTLSQDPAFADHPDKRRRYKVQSSP